MLSSRHLSNIVFVLHGTMRLPLDEVWESISLWGGTSKVMVQDVPEIMHVHTSFRFVLVVISNRKVPCDTYIKFCKVVSLAPGQS